MPRHDGGRNVPRGRAWRRRRLDIRCSISIGNGRRSDKPVNWPALHPENRRLPSKKRQPGEPEASAPGDSPIRSTTPRSAPTVKINGYNRS